ncbi:GNAT family N-acetyltransferase [Paenibacillus chibensis]|uniref:GNAT family N-acetyltransferase n=1 Tax=Paenibacillus chibensis TaxID=59846 RepID=UPI002DB8D37E|nr:GNAT family N-acetyltransferase [Paenibacillus chibensis]MEC0370416.1 GNAT family N-acetyltransferase [Paenibacillus chibensis]
MDHLKRKTQIHIQPWTDPYLELLFRLNAPEMLEHLGGPENDEQVEERHRRYLRLTEDNKGCMYGIHFEGIPEPVGNVGYWDSTWNGDSIYEIGWGVLPAYQNKGIASAAAAAAIEEARKQHKHRFVHAFPSVDHPASNGICRKLGFTLISECDFEYPKGSFMRCNDWRLEL